jgi:hypothetical protein
MSDGENRTIEENNLLGRKRQGSDHLDEDLGI